MNDYLVQWRHESANQHKDNIVFQGYEQESYLLNAKVPRFGSGEAKGIVQESVRGRDLYLMVDVCNYSLTYSLCGHENHMSPDDHYQDLKRIIAACGGKARRITVIMPFLYESRQHKRSARESLDCALGSAGAGPRWAWTISLRLTLTTRVSRMRSRCPVLRRYSRLTSSSKPCSPTSAIFKVDSEHLMVISPDEGGMGRAVYLANVLGIDMGMFYKRRDYARIVNGRNPIVAHEFLGSNVAGKDVVVIDDMISSGESMIDVARQLKALHANRIFLYSTFGLFTNGMEKFDEAYKEGLFDRLFTTNLVYQSPELLSREYYISCDMSKYIALLIDTLNHDASISDLLDPFERIHRFLEKYKGGRL